jgi:hypothetical protein
MPPRKAASEAAPPAVNLNGEITIELEGTEYHLRPSHQAIQTIEEKAGRSLFSLARGAQQQLLTNAEVGIVMAELMRAYGRSHPDDPLATTYAGANAPKVAQLAYEAGMVAVQVRLGVLLGAAVTGGCDAQGEMKPAKAKQPPLAG